MISPISHTEVIEGRVAKANEHGIVLEGQIPWFNISKYAKPRPVVPHTGEHVRLILDKDGYVREVERVPYETDGVDSPAPEEPSRQVEAPSRGAHHAAPDKDQRITRMACLNTATAILSSGGKTTVVADVMAAAEVLEGWVCR
jgi:hypothetical protein